MTKPRRLVDIAVNLTDGVFRGLDHRGRANWYPDDFTAVLARARAAGVEKIVISGTSIEVSRQAIALCQQHRGFLYCTVGVHPAHSDHFIHPSLLPSKAALKKMASAQRKANQAERSDAAPPPPPPPPPGWSMLRGGNDAETAMQQAHVANCLGTLRRMIEDNKDVVVAVGEIGIDHAELTPVVSPALQLEAFNAQLELAAAVGLPMFLHSRDCGMDFGDALALRRAALPDLGVVHSFTGSDEELQKILGLGYDVSVNCASFRSEAASRLLLGCPLDRLHIETDAPWCDVRPENYGHQFVATQFATRGKDEGFVVGHGITRRNEPCNVVQVLEMLAGARQAHSAETTEDVADVLWRNAHRLFPGIA
jgi:Tat protein secretion system quality control protein TatD with DNase activity